jgi:hypothetical protein
MTSEMVQQLGANGKCLSLKNLYDSNYDTDP